MPSELKAERLNMSYPQSVPRARQSIACSCYGPRNTGKAAQHQPRRKRLHQFPLADDLDLPRLHTLEQQAATMTTKTANIVRVKCLNIMGRP
jgi:hypothetical protein